jgi:large-conductance mechanosensitive channel
LKIPNENLKEVNFVLVNNKTKTKQNENLRGTVYVDFVSVNNKTKTKQKRKISYGKYIEIILIIALVVFLLIFFLEQFFHEGTLWIPILY